jgi:hypothetical protein
MDAAKLAKLREKYADEKMFGTFNHYHKISPAALCRMEC